MTKVDVVASLDGDWVAVYFDGKVVDQNHSVGFTRIIEKLVGKTVESITIYETDMSEIMWAPESLSEFHPSDLTLRG